MSLPAGGGERGRRAAPASPSDETRDTDGKTVACVFACVSAELRVRCVCGVQRVERGRGATAARRWRETGEETDLGLKCNGFELFVLEVREHGADS